MTKQKVMSQMKGQDKTPEKQLNELEIGNFPEKEFKIMIVRMIQDLRKTMEKKQEMFTNNLVKLKNKQTEMNNTLLLSCFSRVRLCATPQTAAHQALLSLGFSRQEHWSGLPFPSPMHKSEEWKWSRSVVSDPQQPPWTAAFQAPPSMGFSRQEYWNGVPLPSPE